MPENFFRNSMGSSLSYFSQYRIYLPVECSPLSSHEFIHEQILPDKAIRFYFKIAMETTFIVFKYPLSFTPQPQMQPLSVDD